MDIRLFIESFRKLENYCCREEYKGWDPYDGLNSGIFQAIPIIRDWDLARLAWIQSFKRNPVNLRELFLVPKEYNAKGLGLLLSAYCNIYNCQIKSGEEILCSNESVLLNIHFLADLLLSGQSKGYSGACWGYNFDWQAKRLFFFPKNTPTVVVTSFCCTALFKAYEITKEKKYLETAVSSANFILNDLKRTPSENGFLFSYSPLNGNNTVYNASLLGSSLLSRCYHYTNNEVCKKAAFNSAEACIAAQNSDGSWFYGGVPGQKWIDSFHTGYNLENLAIYQYFTGDRSFSNEIEKGFDFYLKNFFLDDGMPKYYNNKIYPIDIHCPAQLFVTLSILKKFEPNKVLADKVMGWTIHTMQDRSGYFYYQIRRGINSRIPYMRWSNAFMLYGMSYYLLSKCLKNEEY
jgi:hypothetical protein